MPKSGGGRFQTEGTTRAEALKWEQSLSTQRTKESRYRLSGVNNKGNGPYGHRA